jgi:hypothetical protein
MGHVVSEIMKLSPEKLKDICEMMEKPKLVIVPDNSFDDKVSAMNEHRHYKNKKGESQESAYVNDNEDSPYRYFPKARKSKVSIVDGVVHPKQLEKVSTGLRERREFLTKKYIAKGMRHIDKDEYAILMQQSLIEAVEYNDNNFIIDNYETGDTCTFLDPESLTKTTLVANAAFNSRIRRVFFFASVPDDGNVFLRGRAAVQVFEF